MKECLKQNHTFSAAKIVGDNLFFSEYRFNGLFCMNLATKQISFVCFFEGEEVLAYGLHKCCILHNKKLFFLPERAKGIHIYDMENKQQHLIQLDEDTRASLGFYSDVIMQDDILWIFPLNSKQPLMKLDVQTLQLEQDWDFTQGCTNYWAESADVFFVRLCARDNSVFLCGYDSNKIIEWNMETKTFTEHKLSMDYLFSISLCKNKFWLTNLRDGDILCWTPEDGEIYYHTEIKCESGRAFNNVIEVNDAIFIIPAFAEDILVWNVGKEEFQNCLKYDSAIEFGMYGMPIRFFGYDIVADSVFLFPFGGNGLLEINTKKTEMLFAPLELRYRETELEPYRSLYKAYWKVHVEKGIVFEYEHFPLSVFQDMLLNEELKREEKNGEICGKNIWRNIMLP